MVLVSLSPETGDLFPADSSAEWLPKDRPGNFLYIRPAVIGNGAEINPMAPAEALMFVVAVAWPDFSATRPGTVPKPPGLKLLASKSDVRAWPGGFGYAKVGANYGPAFVSHMEGRKLGYDQILWLLGSDFQVRRAFVRSGGCRGFSEKPLSDIRSSVRLGHRSRSEQFLRGLEDEGRKTPARHGTAGQQDHPRRRNAS